MSAEKGGERRCDAEKLLELLRLTASEQDLQLGALADCGYVLTTSHLKVRELIREAESGFGPKPLILVYGEAGTGKSFLARSTQLELLTEAKSKIERRKRGECTGPVILPVYVNLAKIRVENAGDQAYLISKVSEAIESETLNALARVFTDSVDFDQLRRLTNLLHEVKSHITHNPALLPAFFSLLRLGELSYFIILDELTSVVGDIDSKEGFERLKAVVFDGVVRQWRESLGDILAGFMVILHLYSKGSLEILRDHIEGKITAYAGGLERFRLEEIGMDNIMPVSDEAVINWLGGAGISNQWVAWTYREIVSNHKFRFGSMFLEWYLKLRRGRGTAQSLAGLHQEASRRLEGMIAEALAEELRNRGFSKPVKSQHAVGNLRCDIFVDDVCIDVKVKGDPSTVAKEAYEDWVRLGRDAQRYRLVYAVVSDQAVQLSLKEIPGAVVVPVEVPELDTIYEALVLAEKSVKGEEASRSTPRLIPLLAPRPEVDFQKLFLRRVANVAAARIAELITQKPSAVSYDVTVYNLVKEDCRKLNGRSRTDWKNAPSLKKVFGKQLRYAQDVDKAVEEVNKRIAGSGLKLVVTGTSVRCMEEK
ncbi:ATP-binding protein [Infirmifilum sp. NZ]|uniref:ATP-binding protein n=1 Tax=Infirmifilum sp. NZ TaxID=2926850 RepID=UPI0027AAB29F|nr:ATP-binding protein [Infirmifilum sp. NZ]UNQ73708.1 ATP-binding protein [Infirmifilum sp. NZ]